MATAIVSAKREINKGRHDEFPLKVIYSDTEPARNYIWGHPNGQYYVWTDCKWVRMELPQCCNHHEKEDCCNKCCDCVSKEWIETRLANVKKDILSAFLRITRNGCTSSDALENVVRELQQEVGNLSNQILELRGADVEINTAITNLNSNTDSRLDALEDHDATNCVTAEDVPDVIVP